MASAATHTGPRGFRRARVDRIGLGALVLAAIGLAATILVLRSTPADEPPVAPGIAAVLAPAPPERDRWYLDGRPSTDVPKDDWYVNPPYWTD